MLKKAAIVAATTGALMLAGSPAFATGGGDGIDNNDHNNHTGQVGLVNVNDVLNHNNVGLCDLNVNVLAVQVRDVLNDLGVAVPVLSPQSPAANETVAPDICVADTEVDGH
ncbi:hypothetical protein SAMN05216266_12455 [Amycolatopsis marina]|uniref:RdlA protein n=1 Tax=Amycolatopsis marina TaxID=490629 RepID=A0A1I1CGG8_9PSEU|nr:hypothetical protein [Amycolatopsis marina]SFB59780.1 hypothetical protein SAMN05216266_12455 [Amycolatopsis marina]